MTTMLVAVSSTQAVADILCDRLCWDRGHTISCAIALVDDESVKQCQNYWMNSAFSLGKPLGVVDGNGHEADAPACHGPINGGPSAVDVIGSASGTIFSKGGNCTVGGTFSFGVDFQHGRNTFFPKKN
jgi:hypothetical protein